MCEGKNLEGGGALKSPPPPGSYRVKLSQLKQNSVMLGTDFSLAVELYICIHYIYVSCRDKGTSNRDCKLPIVRK